MSETYLSRWMQSYEHRKKLYPDKLKNSECVRLIHTEGTPLRADKLGDVIVLGWWQELPPSEAQWDLLQKFLDFLMSETSIRHWLFQHKSKTHDSSEKKMSAECPEVWIGTENGMSFEFRRDQGVSSCGLFLDQRDHRAWLKANAKNKDVLNLFAYTGGFSVAAALGEAAQTTTVDLSAKYIEWSKQNFLLNGLNLADGIQKFYAMDSIEYLKYAARKNLIFDIIICDPPSYSRNKGKDFRIDRDFSSLIALMAKLLKPKGLIHFSSNYENWSAAFWEGKLRPVCTKFELSIKRQAPQGGDFEQDGSQTLMKAFHLKQK